MVHAPPFQRPSGAGASLPTAPPVLPQSIAGPAAGRCASRPKLLTWLISDELAATLTGREIAGQRWYKTSTARNGQLFRAPGLSFPPTSDPVLPGGNVSSGCPAARPVAGPMLHLPVLGTSSLVLVIGSDEPARHCVLGALQPAGYRLLQAAAGPRGVVLAGMHRPDLIISVVRAASRAADEVCRHLKAHAPTSHIPVIVLADQAPAEDKLRQLENGADGYLSSPFSPRELRAQVRNLLALRHHLRAAYTGGRDPTTEAPVGGGAAPPSRSQAFLERVVRAVEQHLDDSEFSVDVLSAEIALSRTQVHRKLKALTGQSISGFIRSTRLHRAYALLQAQVATVSEVAYQVGFSSPAHFSTSFSRQFGHAPSQVPGK